MIKSEIVGCVTAALLFVLAPSCTKTEPLAPKEGEYGLTKEVKVFSEGGTQDIAVTSTGHWNATLSYQSKTWVSLEGETSGTGDGIVSISYKSNDGLPRQGALYIASDTRATIDTILIKQYGIEPALRLYGDVDSLSFTSVASAKEISLDTNLPECEYENLEIGFDYEEEGEPWAGALLSGDLKTVTVTLADNPEFVTRRATLWIEHKDGWGDVRRTEFPVSQAAPGGTPQTVLKTFAEVRALLPGAADTLRITDDIMIQGFIISDKEGQNMGDCPEVTMTRSDYTQNDRTAYFESEDGSLGFRLLFNSGEENTFSRYDNAKLWLKGKLLTKETDPERYTISDLGAGCVVSSVAGTAESLPSRTMYIKDLQDSDIYTYVTLKKCEFPIRRGGLMMFYNDAYRNRMTKYAQVVADIHGNTIRALYNLKSPIATSTDEKKGAPKGQGPMSGVIVHETYTRFDPADGNMGRYQIRNVSVSDIQITESANDSYMAALVEWADNMSDGVTRRVKPADYGYEMEYEHWVVQPTYGMGAYYFYNITRPELGQWPCVTASWVHGTGLGSVANAAYGYNSWWNATAQDYNYAIWRFSTKDVTSSMVTFSIAGRGYNATGAIPYWYLDYSTDEGQTWQRIGEFTIPAQSGWSPTTSGTIAAETTSYFVIPNDILGLDVAMIRMIPARDIMGTSSAWNGDTISSGNASCYMALCYSAVRYKK